VPPDATPADVYGEGGEVPQGLRVRERHLSGDGIPSGDHASTSPEGSPQRPVGGGQTLEGGSHGRNKALHLVTRRCNAHLRRDARQRRQRHLAPRGGNQQTGGDNAADEPGLRTHGFHRTVRDGLDLLPVGSSE